jgi:cysteine sulfinate desulfinase/cysteine desulfurase-like protein
MGMPRQEIFSVNGKSVLVLNDRLTGTGKFEVDYLILNIAGRPDADQLLKVVRPHTLVVSGKYSEKQVEAIEKACREAGVVVHNTGTQGAFVVSN